VIQAVQVPTPAVPVKITDLESPAFGRLFTSVQRSWFRLEALQVYDVRYEREEFARFLQGEGVDLTPGPWQEMIHRHVAAGRHLTRVHVVEEPHTDYIRYELAGYPVNVEAGEDVRIIPVRRGTWPAGVPRRDFWLFDDRDAWPMVYDSAGRFLYTEMEDPATLAQYRRWRDAALTQSLGLAAYIHLGINQ
jgi:hypothetical protein